MEVFVRNLPEQATEKQIDKFFGTVLEKLGINTYHCQKLKGRGLATLTILDVGKARQFLSLHGQTTSSGLTYIQQKLYLMRRPLNCSLSNKTPDPFLLLSLKKKESDRYVASRSKKPKIVSPGASGVTSEKRRAFEILSLKCGQWAYVGNDLTFAIYSHEKKKGRMIFGHRVLFINLVSLTPNSPSHQVEIPYDSIHSFTIGPQSNPSITLSLCEAPKLYEKLAVEETNQVVNSLNNMFRDVAIHRKRQTFSRMRIMALSKSHEVVVSSCLCYRFLLADPNDVGRVMALKKFPLIPDSISMDTSSIGREPFAAQLTALHSALTGPSYGALPFDLKFQMQRLAQNGYLAPTKVVELLPVVSLQLKTGRTATVVQSVRNLCGQLPFAGPDTEGAELSLSTISDRLLRNQASIERGEVFMNELAEQYDHIAMVHKAMVTPTGIYLFGPEPEIKNRVLRKYSAFPNHFLSVSFLDENGQSLRYDRQTSGDKIFHVRFKNVLEGIINIAGRGYEFLGFSHSSLRAQTCWFMAPFTLDGDVIFARSVIKNLGDFSSIRSPAKCAARIGQTFSQTMTAVSIPPEAFSRMPDVERNGRTFSDGVGTCSSAVLQEIWKKFSQARGLKPTVLQIRFQGAKGVISLDTRLEGTALRLRPSMIKFGCADVADIEICGAALRTLPMYLNRQLIKILEDLGVPGESFLHLQAAAVEKLRMTTESAINAASFFERNFIGKAARLPWLIRKLWAIGISFGDDNFLRNSLELAVLVQLREIKHRSRIFVEKAVTVYGIMDETELLQEGEVYCSVQLEERVKIVTGNVIVTRSPALHPGDVQCVTAVDVPLDSPLRALHNVLVFSSQGMRDLPSQLSGGDLDGDLYNVIYDETLYPKRLSCPADYQTLPPIDIGRPVEKSDITDFFIKFMENDKLSQIATLHQILADQKAWGTFDPICIDLAGLHSTAVDFSKTGVPVDFHNLPRYPKERPDFLAPGPRVLIKKTINFEEDEESSTSDQDDELDEVAKYGPSKVRYYMSPKILGRLYREIDEFDILEHIQAQSTSLSSHSKAVHSIADVVWRYVEGKTSLIQWRHHLQFARDVKESYEYNLVDTMMQYSNHPLYPVSEVEVFSGSILGKNGSQSKRQREFSIDMKERYERDVAYIVSWITRGEDGNTPEEALERSIACLYVACNSVRVKRRVGTLVSFVWVAAAVCLKEVEKLPGAGLLL